MTPGDFHVGEWLVQPSLDRIQNGERTTHLRPKTMVAWVGLRGAVPIILATFPQLAGLPQADVIFDIVFFITLTSVLIQGTSIPFVARWLRVTAPAPAPAQPPIELHPTDRLNSALVEVPVPSGSSAIGRQIVELRLPPEALVILIGRGAEFIVPNGSTVVEPGDRLLVLADAEALKGTREIVAAQREPIRA
jgi:cell volume regulation protein A